MKLKKGTLLFLLLTCLAYTTLAQEVGYELKNTDVTIENGKITNYKSSNTNIIIPEKIGDITITGIGSNTLEGVFQDKNLVSVAFASDSKVTTIGDNAFRDNLIETLTLPPLLTTIGESAFRRNEDTEEKKITELTLPNTLTTIGRYAFHKNLITGLSLPDKLTTIGSYAFFKNKITGLSLPNTLTTIGQGAFHSNAITTLTIPNEAQLETIGASAFQNNKITELTLPTTLRSIGVHAFSGNTELKGIILPEHAIGYNCIYKDSNNQEYSPGETFTNFERSIEMIPHHILKADDVTVENGIITACTCKFENKRIIIPNEIGDITITGIGDEAFKGQSLVAVVFAVASEVTTIGASAFQDNLIVTLTLPPLLTTIGESAFRRNEDTEEKKITELTLPNTLTTIGRYAFHKNLITELSLPDKLTTIGSYAFFKNKITGLSLPNTLTTIGQGAFHSNAITTLTIPNEAQLETIGASAFQNNKITELTLPTTLRSIGVHAFSDNTGLTGIILPEHAIGYNCIYKDSNNQEYSPGETFTNFERSIEMIPHHILKADDVTVENGIITACTCKFENKRIIIPNEIGGITITGIGDEAFKGQSLVAVEFVLGSEVTTIGASAFQNNQITTLTIPNEAQLETIGASAFQNNQIKNNLLTLPFQENWIKVLVLSHVPTLTTIGKNAFSGNTDLPGILLPYHDPKTGVIVIFKDSNDQVYKSSGSASFFTDFDRSLVMLYILQEVDVTVDDQGIITGCKEAFSKTSIFIPVQIGDITITGIGDEAFKNKSLITVAFEEGSEVTTIGASAFRQNQITELTLPPSLETIGDSAFYNNSLTSVTFNDNPNKSQIKSIGNDAFSENTGLTITLPKHAEATDVTYKDSNDQVYKPGATFSNFDRSLVTVIPIFYTLQEGDVTVEDGIITACKSEFSETRIIIPVEIDGETITGIAGDDPGIFKDKNLVSLKFADDSEVTTIGEFAFSSNKITTLILPTTLTIIGHRAFWFNEIPELTLPTALTTIGAFAFRNNEITELTFLDDSQLTTIGDDAFASNPLVSFKLPIVTIEGGRTYWQEGDSKNLGVNPTILNADFGESFKLVSIEQFTLTVEVNNEAGGSIEPSDDHFVIDKASAPSTQKLTAKPNDGWRFDKWVITGGEDNNGNPIIKRVDVVNVKFDADKTATAHFVKQVTLTTAVEGEQRGTIARSVKPNNKGEYDISTIVTLTATPANQDWRFDKWVITDEEDITDNPTTITLDQDKTATAHFVQQVTLTLTIVETGASNVVSGLSAGENKIDKGVDFKLEAMPASGQRFVSWTIGEETIVTEEYTLPATTTETNINIKVTFVAIQVTLTLAIEGEGSINPLVKPNSVDPDNEMKGMYDINTKVTLTAKPNPGWGFDKWVITGGEDEYGDPITVTVDADKTATAHFVKQVTLTTAVEGEQRGTIARSVKPNNDKEEYDINTKVTLTARPNPRWRFDKWVITGEEENNDNPTDVTVDADKTATAHFVEQVTLTLTIEETEASNKVSGLNAGENKIDKGADFKLKAMPASGQKFISWTIDGRTIKNEEYTLPAIYTEIDIIITVTFGAIPPNNQVTLTLAIEGEGSTTPDKGEIIYEKDYSVELTAKPNDGWKFDKWEISDEENKTDNPTDVTVDADKTATAHFVEAVTLTLTIEETEASNVVSGLSAGDNKIDKGADFKLEAMPASGQKFVSWTIDGKTITNEEYTLPATDTKTDIIITVTFVAIPIEEQVTLTLAIEGEGSINPKVGETIYEKGKGVELTATPNEGWRFDKWEISDEEDKTENPTTITLDQDKTVTAHFVEGEEAITSILTEEVVSANPYPNPVTSQITLKAKDGDLIQLFSQKGKQQYSTQHTGNEAHTIDVSTMPVGVYLVRITDAEGNTTTKRILKK